MKKLTLLLLLAIATISLSHAQHPSKGKPVKEADVPKTVKEAFNNNIGFPVEQWLKLTLSNGARYVAVVNQMHQSSGKTIPYRYRYNEQGQLTSTSQYRGDGKNEGKDFISVYLSTGDNDDFDKKVNKIIQDNTLISFEGFGFVPGNQFDKFITTHRLVLEKNGKRTILYFDGDGKEVDMTKYPIRKLEAEEID